MRKASREMPAEWALEVLKRAPFITVSFTRADGTAYGLPMSMACTDAPLRAPLELVPLDGEKLDAIRAHPEVCLSAVTRCQPTVGPKDGSFTLQYQSAVAFGRAEIVTSDEEKILGLRVISQRYLPHHFSFSASLSKEPPALSSHSMPP